MYSIPREVLNFRGGDQSSFILSIYLLFYAELPFNIFDVLRDSESILAIILLDNVRSLVCLSTDLVFLTCFCNKADMWTPLMRRPILWFEVAVEDLEEH